MRLMFKKCGSNVVLQTHYITHSSLLQAATGSLATSSPVCWGRLFGFPRHSTSSSGVFDRTYGIGPRIGWKSRHDVRINSSVLKCSERSSVVLSKASPRTLFSSLSRVDFGWSTLYLLDLRKVFLAALEA
jgi:hypothetical protein